MDQIYSPNKFFVVGVIFARKPSQKPLGDEDRAKTGNGIRLIFCATRYRRRIYALSTFTLVYRVQGWYFKRTDHDDDWRGPFSSEISVCPMIGRALCKELKKRDGFCGSSLFSVG